MKKTKRKKKMYNNFDSKFFKKNLNKRIFEKIKQLKFSEAIKEAINESIHIENIEKILLWCNYKKIFVNFFPTDQENYSNSLRRIQVNSDSSLESQMFTLLHECGHHLIFESAVRDPQLYIERFSRGYYSQLSEEIISTYGRKISIIAEEIEAWVRGFNLSKRLDLKIDYVRFEEYKNRCLESYVKWGLEKED
jgi:hypothetical protein